jgi:hypothetical protein
MENMEENCEMIWKIWKKAKLISDKIGKIRKKSKLNSEKDLEIMEETQAFHYILPYCPYLFTIFFCIFHIISLFN